MKQIDQNLLNNLSKINILISIYWTIYLKETVWSESIEQSVKRKQFDQNLLNNLSKGNSWSEYTEQAV